MTSPILTENYYTGAFLIREATGTLSRDAGVINNGTNADVGLQGGLVMSLTSPTTAAAAALGTNTGDGTFGAITVAAPALAGVYTVLFVAATKFVLESPLGSEMGHGTTGTAFSAGGIGFTITTGATAFVAGDSFTVTVAAADGSWTPYVGTAPAAGVLYDRTFVPANGSKRITLITRQAEVNLGELQWDATVTGSYSAATLQANALAQLAALSIIARNNPTSAG